MYSLNKLLTLHYDYYQDSEAAFDDAIKLILKNQRINRIEIMKAFAQSYINENKLPYVTIGNLDKGLLDGVVSLCVNGDEVYLSFNDLTNKKNALNGIINYFHELEHCLTYRHNKSICYFDDKPYVNFGGMHTYYKFYLASQNEYNSRCAGIKYAKKFLKRLTYIVNNEVEYNTPENQKYILKIQRKLTKKEIKHNKKYNKLFKYLQKDSTKEKYKRIARKLFKNIKIAYQENNENFLNGLYKLELNEMANWLIGYFNIYKDYELFNEVLIMAMDNKNIFAKKLDLLLQTNQLKGMNVDFDKFLLNYGFNNNYENLDIAKLNKKKFVVFNLLFNGRDWFENNTHNIKTDELERILLPYKNYIFKGIPFKENRNGTYTTIINNTKYNFKTKRDMFLMVSNFIKSSDLEKIDVYVVDKINSIFKTKVIDCKKVKNPIKKYSKLKTLNKTKEIDIQK